MPGDPQRVNVPALVLLAVLTGGTASIAGIKFSWVPTDERPAVTGKDLQAVQRELDELRTDLRALTKGNEELYRNLIEIREQCKHVEWRCQRLERGYRHDPKQY